MSTPYKIDLEDINFVFFDQLRVPEVLGKVDEYAEFDSEIYRATFEEAARMARDVLSPLNRIGDREGCKLDDDGNVTTPAAFKPAWKQLAEGGWIAPSAPVDYGGAGFPRVVSMVCSDMFTGGATGFMMYQGLTAAAGRIVLKHGPDSIKDMVTKKLFGGQWSGTMCLTEAGAGTSVGDNRAKATPSDDGTYLLEGEKIFISGGDCDLVENIIHLVLARTPGSPHGTKGLSLFMVPKYDFADDGTLGERNGAKVVGIEHKMGLNGSSTCTLAFGADRPCKGWLVGKERQGITLMFKMMNEARIGVATQGESVAVASYNYAIQYARERVQGTSLRMAASKEGDSGIERVTITQHPDVRRMLMTLKVLSEAMRSACFRLAFDVDVAETTSDEAHAERLRERIDLLVPVLKAHCTDLAFELASTAVQVYGGYGYIGEFPVEQLVRDSKIQAIYEGTNGIQAMDLLGRKMRLKGGALFMTWLQDAQGAVKAAGEAGFVKQAELLGKALGQLGACAMHLGGLAKGGKLEAAFYHATPYLKTFGVVMLGLEVLEQAMVAKRVIEERGETPHLRSKLLGLDFYVAQILPGAVAYAKMVQSGDESALDEVLFA